MNKYLNIKIVQKSNVSRIKRLCLKTNEIVVSKKR